MSEVSNVINSNADFQHRMDEIIRLKNSANPEYGTLLSTLLRDAEHTGNRLVESFCCSYLAEYYYMQLSDLDKFHSYLKKAFQLQEELNDYKNISISYNLLGIDALNNGNYQLAAEYFFDAMNSDPSNERQRAIEHFNIAQMYYNLLDYKNAAEYMEKALNLFRLHQEDHSLWFNYIISVSQLGIDYLALGKDAEADHIYDLFQELKTSGKYPNLFLNDPVCWSFLARRAFFHNDLAEEGRCVGEFIKNCRNNEGILDLFMDIQDLAVFLLDRGQTERIPELLEIIKEPAYSSGINHYILDFLELKIRYYNEKGDVADTIPLYKEYYEVNHLLQYDTLRVYRMSVDLRSTIESMKEEQREIEAENARLFKEASTDPLTGLANRASLRNHADLALSRAKKGKYNFGFELLDFDSFKQYNDTYGHLAGDDILRKISNVLLSVENDHIFAARYGGDEFCLVYENMSDDEIMSVAKQIQKTIRDMKVPHINSKSEKIVTVSQGIRNSLPFDTNEVWDFTYAADSALYQVKKKNPGGIILLQRISVSDKALESARTE